jgi:PAS domain S-box-containing protein
MFSVLSARKRKSESEGLADAITRSQALIEFAPDGTILTANANCLALIGYAAEEIAGKPGTLLAGDFDSRALCNALGRGECPVQQHKWAGKEGHEIWIEASYAPVRDGEGALVKVVALVRDITAEKQESAANEAQIAAVGRVMAVAELALDGTILRVNGNFLKAFGFAQDELAGQHHRMLVEPVHAGSDDYKAFCEKLAGGEPQSGVYKRIGKDGKEVWIRASYHPMRDAGGKLCKVLELATDITQGFVANRKLQAAAIAVLDAAEKNDLSKRVPLEGHSGELAAVCAGVNRMLESMCGVIGRISGVAREVLNASAEISASTDDLQGRTESQAATLQETAASMTKIAETVKDNAANAQEANRSAGNALGIAGRGGEVVGQTVQAMARIEESSDRAADQSARAQRRGRSRARGRRRARLCRRGVGSAQPRAAFLAGRQGHQESDRDVEWRSAPGRRTGEPRRQRIERDRRGDQGRRRARLRHRAGKPAAGRGCRAGQQGAEPDG